MCAVGRKSYNTGYLVFKNGTTIYLAFSIAPNKFSLFKQTPLGIPVLPEVYIIIETCSKSVSSLTRSFTLSVKLSPRLNKSVQVYTSAFNFLASDSFSLDILSENMTCLIGLSSPNLSNSAMRVLTCLSMPSTNKTEHCTFLMMNSSASTPKLSYNGTVV